MIQIYIYIMVEAWLLYYIIIYTDYITQKKEYKRANSFSFIFCDSPKWFARVWYVYTPIISYVDQNIIIKDILVNFIIESTIFENFHIIHNIDINLILILNNTYL